MKIKSIITLFASLVPIGVLKKFLLNCLGHQVSYKSKIGLSPMIVDHIVIESGAVVGNYNLFIMNELCLCKGSFIKNFNYMKGFFNLKLLDHAGISRQNKIRRSYPPVVKGVSNLSLGENSFIVSNHFIDLTESVSIGSNSILAGIRSQLWTHGYYHAESGKERVRIDGSINIGDNVYVGSGCIINPGVNIANAIHVGSGTVVSKTLTAPGMYVGQGLRHIKKDLEMVKKALTKVEDDYLIETVYTKDE